MQSGERNEWNLIPNHPFTATLTENTHPAEKLVGCGRGKKKQKQDSPKVTISYRRPGVKAFSAAVICLRGKFSLGNCISISNRT